VYYKSSDGSVFSIVGKGEGYTYIQYWNRDGIRDRFAKLPGDLASGGALADLTPYPTLEEAFAPPVAKNAREIVDLINTLPLGGRLQVENEALKELAERWSARLEKNLSVETIGSDRPQ
jgi:hypothetical protein